MASDRRDVDFMMTDLGSFPTLEGSSSWNSQYSTASSGRGRSRRRHEGPKTNTPRAQSADARPQYGRRNRSALFHPPNESRAVVTPSPLYTPRYSPDFGMHELDGLFHDMDLPSSDIVVPEGRSFSPAPIRQSRSTESHARRQRSSEIGVDPSWPAHRHTQQNDMSTKRSESAYSWEQHTPPRDTTDFAYLKNSLIMFGDAYADQGSVYTGMSQQELLENRPRDQTSKRKKDKKYGKKKRSDRVVNLPSSFLPPSTLYIQPVSSPDRMSTQQHMQPGSTAFPSKGRTGLRSSLIQKRQQARTSMEKNGSNSRLWNMIPSLSHSRSESRSPPRSRISQNFSDDFVATVAQEQAPLSVNHAHSSSFDPSNSRASPLVTQGELPTEWGPLDLHSSDNFDDMPRIDTTDIPKQKDFVPMISANAAVYVRKTRDAEVVSGGEGYRSFDKVTPPSSRVRFAKNVKTRSLNDATHQSLKEDSPTSVLQVDNTSLALGQDGSYLPKPRRIDDGTEDRQRGVESIQGQQSAKEKPKSILRKGKANRSDGSSTDVHSTDETTSSRSNKSVRISRSPVPEGDSMSEPPPSNGFVDGHGSEISPIEVVDSVGEEIVDFGGGMEGLHSHEWIADGTTHAANSIPEGFHQPILDENQPRDDDSGLISEVYSEFITAVASVVVQTAARQFLARVRTKKLREAKNEKLTNEFLQMRKNDPPAKSRGSREATRLQHGARSKRSNGDGLTTRETGCSDYLQQDGITMRLYALAAVRIQSAFRGWWARDSVAVDHFCATTIQKSFRGYLCRICFRYDLFRVTMAQSIARKYIARCAATSRLVSIVVIQSLVRGFFVRRQESLNYDYLNAAATKIQTQWRRYTCEATYLLVYRDIVIVQTLVRGWITRRLLRAWLKAHNIRLRSLQGRTDWGSDQKPMRALHAGASLAEKRRLPNHKLTTSSGVSNRVMTRYAGKVAPEVQDKGIAARANHAEFRRRDKEYTAVAAVPEEEKSNKELLQRASFFENERRRRDDATSAEKQELERRNNEMAAYGGQVEAPRLSGERQNTAAESTDAWQDLGDKTTTKGKQVKSKFRVSVQTGRRDIPSKISEKAASMNAVGEDQLRNGQPETQAETGNPGKLWSEHKNVGLPNRLQGRNSVGAGSQRTQTLPKLSVQATKKGSGTSQEREDLSPSDRAELLRKERIAYHRDPDSTARRRWEKRRQPLEQGGPVQSSGPSMVTKNNVGEARVELKENYASNVILNRQDPVRKVKSATPTQTKKAEQTGTEVETSATPSGTKVAPVLPPKRQNPFQPQRTEQEQRRIDRIHETFRRVGLMARQPTRRAEEPPGDGSGRSRTKSFNVDHPYDEAHTQVRVHGEASASDLIRAWKTRDQTQPKVQGKLF